MSLLDSSVTLGLVSAAGFSSVVEDAVVLDDTDLETAAEDVTVDRSVARVSSKVGKNSCWESMYCQTKKTRSRKLSCGYTEGQVLFQQNYGEDFE